MSERRFPIMGGPSVPWQLVAPYETQAKQNHDQTLERLAERGGLAPSELWCAVHGKRLCEQPSEHDAAVWFRTWLDEHEGYKADRDSISARLATSTALAAEQANEIERLKGERDEANKRSYLEAAHHAHLRKERDEAVRCLQAADARLHALTAVIEKGDADYERDTSRLVAERDAERALHKRLSAEAHDVARRTCASLAGQIVAANAARDQAAATERERIAAWLERETRAGHGTIAMIRSTSHNPEPGGD